MYDAVARPPSGPDTTIPAGSRESVSLPGLWCFILSLFKAGFARNSKVPGLLRNLKFEIARLCSEASPRPAGNWQEKNAEKQSVLLRKKTVFQTTQNVSSEYLPLQTVNREPGTVNHIRQGLQLLLSNTFSCFL
jgi:hypothetical protein